MDYNNPEVQENSPELVPDQTVNDGEVPEGTPDPDRSKVEFDLKPVEDSNVEYAVGVFVARSNKLRKAYAEMLEEDPSATYRLTLERL